ncbi:MAG TPA: helix-turn-helix transcriptional regulator [Ktedonobacteraceae bacterium]|nr:helix-turn-helix transcriptional regulator [Ktedonobacteraceae bacterium]
MTLQEYRIRLGWSAEDLARQAGINAQTVRRIERGNPTYLHTAGAIARALSEAYGKEIRISDFDGLIIRE